MLGIFRSRKPGRPPDFICECCGASVRGGATFCRECGASEESGWGSRGDVEPTGTEDDFDYDEFVEREFGTGSTGSNWKTVVIWLVVLGLLLGLLGPLLF